MEWVVVEKVLVAVVKAWVGAATLLVEQVVVTLLLVVKPVVVWVLLEQEVV
jgi:hypothetical protein